MSMIRSRDQRVQEAPLPKVDPAVLLRHQNQDCVFRETWTTSGSTQSHLKSKLHLGGRDDAQKLKCIEAAPARYCVGHACEEEVVNNSSSDCVESCWGLKITGPRASSPWKAA